MTTNADLFAAAQAVTPGGGDSPVRAYGSVGGVPAFVTCCWVTLMNEWFRP